MRVTAKQLGDDGEQHTCELLREHGYSVELLQVNARTYDVRASNGNTELLVSVKVSRDKQHVRLGSRRSVLGLEAGNFVFAYPPLPGSEIASLTGRLYALLILPAAIVVNGQLVHSRRLLDREEQGSEYFQRHGQRFWPPPSRDGATVVRLPGRMEHPPVTAPWPNKPLHATCETHAREGRRA